MSQLNYIKCPYCGREYTPSEIYVPKYFFGYPYNIMRNEKEEISRTLYKCPYCEKTYTNVTRYEVHLRTHVSLLFINRPVKNLFPVHTVLRNSTRKEI